MNPEIFSAEEAKTHQFIPVLAELAAEWFLAGGPRTFLSAATSIAGARTFLSAATPKPPAGIQFGPECPRTRNTVLDFGCGNGAYLRHLRQKGFEAFGIEGTHCMTHDSRVVQWDLRHPLCLGRKGNVMCIEVAEHIYAEYHNTLMDTLSRHCAGKLLLTWAVPGQGGLRHVAERTEEQVVPYLARWDFRFLKEQSYAWRQQVGEQCSYLRRSIYLFERGAL